MQMQELIIHSGFEYAKSINEVLNEHDDLFNQYVKIIQESLQKAVDKENYIEREIQDFENNFLNNKPNPAGIYCFPKATPLLQYGFNVIRDFPAFTMISIFEAIEKHENFFKFWECKDECIYVYTIEDSLFGKKICELNYSEALIEAVHFVVQGFNFAKIYVYIKDLKNHNNHYLKTDSYKDHLPVNEIALIHVYNREQITRENADKIAAEYGYISKKSGEGLFQDYTKYCNSTNRTDKPTPCTPKKLMNKIQLLERVAAHLDLATRERVKDEIKILKSIYEDEYQ